MAESVMRDLQEVEIRRSILHLLAPNRRKEKHLSPDVFALSDVSVRKFLVRHIERGLGSGRVCTFERPEPKGEHVAGWCAQAALGRKEAFVDRSHSIAEAMYAEIGRNQNISDAVLAVIAFRAKPPKGRRSPFLALLKLDPGEGFVTEEQRDGTIRIAVQKDMLPRARDGLQKCAFVSPDYDLEYPLSVLDLQTGGAEQDPRLWFLQRFLDARLAWDDVRLTRALNATLHRLRGELHARLTPRQLRRFDSGVHGMWARRRVDLAGLPPDLGLSGEFADIAVERLMKVPAGTFTLDRETADRYLRRKVGYRADNDVEVKGPPGAFGTTVRWDPNPSRRGRLVVTIRTRTWEEIR